MKILIVDDHRLITDALRALLLNADPQAQVFAAADAAGAEILLHSHPDADLMLLDMTLPGAYGTSLLDTLVRQAPQLKILVLSGESNHDRVTQVLRAGARGFVPKSMPPDTLMCAIQFVLSGGIYIPRDLLNIDTRMDAIRRWQERRCAARGPAQVTRQAERQSVPVASAPASEPGSEEPSQTGGPGSRRLHRVSTGQT